jgi:hypothetical protein
MNKRQSIKARFMIIVGLMLALAFMGSQFVWPLMQVQAGPTLPPRDVPTSQPDTHDDDSGSNDRSNPLVAFIELQASSASAGSWSVVQWQDSDGNWHDVEGWRSVLGSDGYQRWTVEAKDFNTGLFRWQVRQGGPDGAVLGTSQTFNLPANALEVVTVSLTGG